MSLSTSATTASSSRSAAPAQFSPAWPSLASAASVEHHSSTWTTLAIAWSAVARPVGRYGVAVKVSISVRLAAADASMSAWLTSPRATACSWRPSAAATAEALARSRSPGLFGDSSRTARVPAAEASHQPSNRDGMVDAPPAEATGRT